jgi:hypothetical protein
LSIAQLFDLGIGQPKYSTNFQMPRPTEQTRAYKPLDTLSLKQPNDVAETQR